MIRTLWAAVLAVLFVVLTTEVRASNWLLALLVGGCASRLVCLSASPLPVPLRVLAFPWFLWGVLIHVAKGATDMSWLVIEMRGRFDGGLVPVALPTTTKTGARMLSLVVTASPGTIVTAVDHFTHQLWVHTLRPASAQKLQSELLEFYRRHQSRIFP